MEGSQKPLQAYFEASTTATTAMLARPATWWYWGYQ
jgi:hypothetical protein